MEAEIKDKIYNNYEKEQSAPRYHLGVSMLGNECDRWLWLSFRWAVIEAFEGRMLRLFLRGHREEGLVISELKKAGYSVKSEENGKQFRVDFGSHVSGSVDGIIDGMLLEIKTHNKKSFSELEKKGVKKSKPVHWIQMQVYMLGLGLKKALYFSVCKDDDSIYTETVELDEDSAKKYVDRGKRIALSDRMPEPCSGASSSWYVCKICPAYSFCHKEKITHQVNCRTCIHSTAREDSTFYCERWRNKIPSQAQLEGCSHHALHPDLVPFDMSEPKNQWNPTYIIKGKDVINGFDGISSKEIVRDAIKGLSAVSN